jgi:hypothetical protein
MTWKVSKKQHEDVEESKIKQHDVESKQKATRRCRRKQNQAA